MKFVLPESEPTNELRLFHQVVRQLLSNKGTVFLIKGLQAKQKEMKVVGTVLIVIGLIASIFTGLQAAGDSESASVLGVEVAVSTADWMPLIISLCVLMAGVVIRLVAKK